MVFGTGLTPLFLGIAFGSMVVSMWLSKAIFKLHFFGGILLWAVLTAIAVAAVVGELPPFGIVAVLMLLWAMYQRRKAARTSTSNNARTGLASNNARNNSPPPQVASRV